MQTQNVTSSNLNAAQNVGQYYDEIEAELAKHEDKLNPELNKHDSETLEALYHDIAKILVYRRTITNRVQRKHAIEATQDVLHAPLAMFSDITNTIRAKGAQRRLQTRHSLIA